MTRKIHHNQLLSTKLGRILRYVKNDVNRAVKLPDYWTVNREYLWTRFSCFGGNFKVVEHLTRFTRKKRANYWISNRSVSIRTSDVATHADYAWFTKTYGLYPSHDVLQVPTLLGVVASVCRPLPIRAQQCWDWLANNNAPVCTVLKVSNFARQKAKTSNKMQQGVQVDASCNIQQRWTCWPAMLSPFARC